MNLSNVLPFLNMILTFPVVTIKQDIMHPANILTSKAYLLRILLKDIMGGLTLINK